jgi:Domain of unknown function (DUF4177)
MPYVSCPTCGERGKIPSGLIGVRIKCKQCGLSFLVAPPATKTVAGAGAMSSSGPSAAVEAQGIEVEGLDAASWAVPSETTITSKAQADQAAKAPETPATSSAFIPVDAAPAGVREYKILTPRDKFFDGRFDLARLEEALNHFGRQGWVAKSMLAPHVKGFSGALEETIVVLLERCQDGT